MRGCSGNNTHDTGADSAGTVADAGDATGVVAMCRLTVGTLVQSHLSGCPTPVHKGLAKLRLNVVLSVYTSYARRVCQGDLQVLLCPLLQTL